MRDHPPIFSFGFDPPSFPLQAHNRQEGGSYITQRAGKKAPAK
jgi:hypothetical protein